MTDPSLATPMNFEFVFQSQLSPEEATANANLRDFNGWIDLLEKNALGAGVWLLTFAASWCPACQASKPKWEQVLQKAKSYNVQNPNTPVLCGRIVCDDLQSSEVFRNELAKQGCKITRLPTYVVISCHDKVIHRMEGTIIDVSSFWLQVTNIVKEPCELLPTTTSADAIPSGDTEPTADTFVGITQEAHLGH
jgi:hypothetical protein